MNEKGLTAIELMLYIAVLAGMSAGMINFFRQPAAIASKLDAAEIVVPAKKAADLFARDLREADPATIEWTTMPPTGTLTYAELSFQKIRYPAQSVVPTIVPIRYFYDPADSTLKRTENSDTKTLVRRGLVAPSGSFPLVQQDTTTLNMVMIQIAVRGEKGLVQKIIRRVSVRS
jgi:hypothetical protein